jgi:hypothetical protein
MFSKLPLARETVLIGQNNDTLSILEHLERFLLSSKRQTEGLSSLVNNFAEVPI